MIVISNEIIERIRQRAGEVYPQECVGALLGVSSGGNGREVRRVLDVVPLENRRDEQTARHRYLVLPEDYRALEREATGRRLDILGFWHSHPDHPARPSTYDREHALPWYSYVIVAVLAGEPVDIRGWMLSDDRSRFEPDPITAVAP